MTYRLAFTCVVIFLGCVACGEAFGQTISPPYQAPVNCWPVQDGQIHCEVPKYLIQGVPLDTVQAKIKALEKRVRALEEKAKQVGTKPKLHQCQTQVADFVSRGYVMCDEFGRPVPDETHSVHWIMEHY